MTLASLTLRDAGEKLRKREFSSVELTDAVFQRIDKTDGKVRAYLTLARDSALEQAKQADERLKKIQTYHPFWAFRSRSKTIF